MCEKNGSQQPDGNPMDLLTVHDLGYQTPKIDGTTKQKSVVPNWLSNFPAPDWAILFVVIPEALDVTAPFLTPDL